ncbi:MAG: cation:proton antiporter [Actinocatenispora sp.]
MAELLAAPSTRRTRWILRGGGTALALVALGAMLLRGEVLSGADPVTRFLFATAVILMVCHLGGALARLVRQPAVVGEVVGGLLLGPSVLGAVWPAAHAWLFPTLVTGTVHMAGQLGLVAFVFLLGCEAHIERMPGARRVVGLVAFGAVVPAFAAGVLLAVLFRDEIAGRSGGGLSYPLFVGLALSVTGLPVLARLLADIGLKDGRAGTVAITAAVFCDATAWGLLALLLSAGTAGPENSRAFALRLTATLLLVLITFFGVRPVLGWMATRFLRTDTSGPALLAVLAAGAIGLAALTQLFGLHPVVGAFLFGAVVPRRLSVVRRLNTLLSGFTIAVLLPMFFADIGLTTPIGAVGARPALLAVLVLVVFAVLGAKYLGAGVAARLGGMRWRGAWAVGAMMGCGGVTQLVVASVGWQHGLISSFGLAVAVVTALVGTAGAAPIARALLPVGESPAPADVDGSEAGAGAGEDGAPALTGGVEVRAESLAGQGQ